jgi:hypothetical protein
LKQPTPRKNDHKSFLGEYALTDELPIFLKIFLFITPESWFGGMGHGSGAGTDLFELFPADGYVNNLRGNYPLGPVPDPRYVSTSGAKLGACGTPSSSYVPPWGLYYCCCCCCCCWY